MSYYQRGMVPPPPEPFLVVVGKAFIFLMTLPSVLESIWGRAGTGLSELSELPELPELSELPRPSKPPKLPRWSSV